MNKKLVYAALFLFPVIANAQMPEGIARIDPLKAQALFEQHRLAMAINEREAEVSRQRLLTEEKNLTPHCSSECTTLTCGKLRLPNRDGIFFRHEDTTTGEVSIFCKDGRLYETCRKCIGRLARKHRDRTSRSLRY